MEGPLRWVAFVLASSFLVGAGTAHAASLTSISDLISTSAPATTTTTHTLQFTVSTAIPASGKIIITPESDAFSLPLGFNHTDVDLAVSSGGPFNDRDLAASANAVNDGVAVVTGVNSSITITLNSSSGISGGSIILIELGTNTDFGDIGDVDLINPGSAGSYRIAVQTRNASDTMLDSAKAMIAIVNPVNLGVAIASSPPLRSNGLPSGLIEANHSFIEISLNTDEEASCRYATTTGIQYDDMVNMFTTGASSTIFHTTISGHQNDTTYDYHVRCRDAQGTYNLDDYTISFTLKPTPDFDTSVTLPNLGSGGVGPFPNGSSVLFLSNVTISGWSSPQSTIRILKDGVQSATTQASSNGSFQVTVSGLERGAYTFLAYATDRASRISSGYSSTLTLEAGTNNVITNVVIPPTITLESDAVDVGDAVYVLGETIPGSTIDIYIDGAKKYSATSTKGLSSKPDGMWEYSFNSGQLSRGTHTVRARSRIVGQADSAYSKTLFLGVGEEPSGDLALRSDINGDGKVNLVDFSIMLTHWNSDDPTADINSDGTVNLADFSILLFNWTG